MFPETVKRGMRNRIIILLLLFPLILFWVLTCKLFSISEESRPQKLLTENLLQNDKTHSEGTTNHNQKMKT
jgi:hypothetical protein